MFISPFFVSGDEREVKNNENPKEKQSRDEKDPGLPKGSPDKGYQSRKIIQSSHRGFISELLIVLLTQDLSNFNLEIKLPNPVIFYSLKMSPVSKKRKEPMSVQPTPLDKGK